MNGDGPAVTENNENMMNNYVKNDKNNEKMFLCFPLWYPVVVHSVFILFPQFFMIFSLFSLCFHSFS